MPSRKDAKPKQTTLDLELQVQDYLQNRSMRERSAGREDSLKGILMSLLAETGELQAGGHRILTLNEPLEYVEYKGARSKKRTIAGIRRMKRTGTPSLNSDRTMAFLKRKKLTEECTTTEVVINEDAILAATFEGRITDDELKLLYDEKDPTYAFYLVDEGAEDDED